MPVFRFFWTDEIIEHLGEHGISSEDFERIVSKPSKTSTSRSTGRLCAFGNTLDGRYVICIYEMLDALTVYPVTAYEHERQ